MQKIQILFCENLCYLTKTKAKEEKVKMKKKKQKSRIEKEVKSVKKIKQNNRDNIGGSSCDGDCINHTSNGKY